MEIWIIALHLTMQSTAQRIQAALLTYTSSSVSASRQPIDTLKWGASPAHIEQMLLLWKQVEEFGRPEVN